MKNELNELNQKIYECNKCELCKLGINLGSGKLKGEGNKYKIMCVAQNPSYSRKGAGIFLPGSKNNDLFIKMMESCGFKRDSYYVTNLVKCSTFENGELDDFQIKCCSQWIREEIKLLQPRIIICIGSVSGDYFGIRDDCMYKIGLDGIIYFRVQHPSYIIRNGYDNENYLKQFTYIKDKMHTLGVYND